MGGYIYGTKERSKILQRALTPFYHACVDAGIDITEKGGEKSGKAKRKAI